MDATLDELCEETCIPAFELDATSLVKRRGYRRPPHSPVGLFARMLWEKGRLGPFVAEGLRGRWRLPQPPR